MLKPNNFDLIRLLASLQVFFMHSVAFLKLPISDGAAEVFTWFPGVPIFFMISGLLVTHSFFRAPTLKHYFCNRALRIFPGLWVCLLVSLLLTYWQGNIPPSISVFKTLSWFLMQGSFLQFINFLPHPGVINGVLWSLATEIQFYVALPLIVLYGNRLVKSSRTSFVALLLFAIVSAALHQLVLENETRLLPRIFPTLFASIFTNGYLFAIGVAGYLYSEKLSIFCRNKFMLFLAIYVLIRCVLYMQGVSAVYAHASMWVLLIYPLLGLVICSFAYSFRTLSNTLLNQNDFSYGIYLYHMPIIYMALHMGANGTLSFVWVTGVVSLLAAASWYFVERPALRMKQKVHSASLMQASPLSPTA